MSTRIDRTALNAAQRAAALQRLANERYDVIVVGGGVTGAGVALDAASRGLRTALVERVDLAAGTSRWSSKLVHGGLRYLAKGDLPIAYESARERHHLMTTIAPHLTRPLANIAPDTSPAESALADTGILLADGLRRAAGTPSSLLPRPRRLGADAARRLVPGVRAGTRGIRFTDGQLEDDARFVATLARTAAAHGADVVTRCGAVPLDADRVELTDEMTGESFVAHGHVVLATGVWSGETEPAISVTPSRGSHLVLPAAALGHPTAQLNAPVPGHFGRFVFAIPIGDELVLLGLTDELDANADPLAPSVPHADERFLLETINASMERPLTSADVVGRFAGLRPLVALSSAVAGGNAPTADASRKHLLLDEPGRPITITGGKFTTYRRMAEDAVDAVAKRVDTSTQVRDCRTTELPLLGAAPRDALARSSATPRYVRRYGTLASQLDELVRADPSLARPVAEGCATTRAEFAYAISHEGALLPRDLVDRRTRVSFVDAHVPEATETAQGLLEAAGVTD